jgi:hypothetical protein
VVAKLNEFPGLPGHRPRLLGGFCVSRVCFSKKNAGTSRGESAATHSPSLTTFLSRVEKFGRDTTTLVVPYFSAESGESFPSVSADIAPSESVASYTFRALLS